MAYASCPRYTQPSRSFPIIQVLAKDSLALFEQLCGESLTRHIERPVLPHWPASLFRSLDRGAVLLLCRSASLSTTALMQLHMTPGRLNRPGDYAVSQMPVDKHENSSGIVLTQASARMMLTRKGEQYGDSSSPACILLMNRSRSIQFRNGCDQVNQRLIKCDTNSSSSVTFVHGRAGTWNSTMLDISPPSTRG